MCRSKNPGNSKKGKNSRRHLPTESSKMTVKQVVDASKSEVKIISKPKSIKQEIINGKNVVSRTEEEKRKEIRERKKGRKEEMVSF